MIIDAHQHFWNYNAEKHSWIDDSMQVIRRDFLPGDLKKIFEKNNIEGCVTVQVEQTEKETKNLVELGKRNSFIKGVVGWVNFKSPQIQERLEYFSQFKTVKGFRHIVQAEPKNFLYDENFRNGISFLKKYNFSYDILIYPHQLKPAIQFAAAFPDQSFVLNHIAKPSIKKGLINDWKKNIVLLASLQNVWCKISGLVTEADWKNHPYKNFIPYIEVAVNAFGTNRIMFGSDWPVCLLADNYKNVLNLMRKFFQSFSKDEQDKFFALNAIEFYKLNIN